MKKSELLARLEAMETMSKADIIEQIAKLKIELGPVTTAEPGKIVYFVELGEKKLDPNQKYPKQMLTCYDLIAKEIKVGERVTRAKILELIGNGAEELNTRQSPERIYAFYQKRMEDEGWLKREQERVEA